MSQPKWKLAANLGDTDPAEHGGFLVWVDETGVYPPEMSVYEPFHLPDERNETLYWTVHELTLDRCTFVNGHLSDNIYRPEEVEAWFWRSIPSVADSAGVSMTEVIRLLCSDDPVELADGYLSLGFHHGWHEFDNYPAQGENTTDLPDRVLSVIDPAEYSRRMASRIDHLAVHLPFPILRDWWLEAEHYDEQLADMAHH